MIEIEGYKAQMNAICNMERQNYEEAINDFLKAKLIFSQIGATQDTLEAIIYNEKVSQLETFIRSCAASLQINSDIQLADEAELTAKIKSASDQSSSGAKTASDDAEMTEKGSLQSEIKLNGRVIPLKSVKLREAFAALTALEKEIASLRDGQQSDKLV